MNDKEEPGCDGYQCGLTMRSHSSSRLVLAVVTPLSALAIVSPSINERLTIPVTPVAPPSGTEAVVSATVPGPGGIKPGAIETLPEVWTRRRAA